MITHIIPKAVPSMAVEKYMRRAWPMLPGHVLRDAFKARDIRVNGVKCEKNAPVRGGDTLSVYIADKYLRPEPEILFSDDRLIVCVKPQQLPVDIDSDGIGADTMLSRLQTRWPEIRLCHRLDAQTGGLLLAANDPEIYEQALEAFRDHIGVRKTYAALALNPFDQKDRTLKAWLIKDAKRSAVRVLHKPQPGAKPVETRWHVIEKISGNITRVALEPVTGRTHQLRAHMADAGHPLLGDDHYGDRAANKRYAPVPLTLWHETLFIPQDSPLRDYAGMTFHADAPDWLKRRTD